MRIYRSIPYSVFRIPYSVFRIPYSVFRIPYSVFRIPYSVFRIPYSVFRIPYSVFRIPYSVFRIPYSVFRIPYSVFRIPYSVFRIPYSVFRIPYSVFRIPYSVFRIPYSVFRIPYSVFRIPYSVFCACGLFISIAGMNQAEAARSAPGGHCATNTTALSTIIIGNVNKAPDINSFLSFSCSDVIPLKPGRRMVYCWHIHGGAYTSRFEYRQAKLDGNIINFNFYAKDFDGGTKKVGSAREPYNIIGYATRTGTNGTSDRYDIQAPFTLRFEGNESSVSLPAGKYTYNAGGTHFLLSNIAESDEMNYKNACVNANGDITGHPQSMTSIPLNISVKTYCNIRVSKDLLFLKQVKLDKPVKADATVNVDCSAGTDYSVKIDNGNNYFDNMRHMEAQHGTKEMVAYTISPEEWTGIGLGTPQGQDWKIDGTAPAQNTPSAGAYKDVLIVNISWQ